MPRKYFSRINTRQQVNAVIDMLNAIPDTPNFPRVKARQESFEIKAPDGEMVFAGLIGSGGSYLCRYHKEVFSEPA